MNYPVILKLLSGVLAYEAAFMILPLIVSLYYGENAVCFAVPIAVLAVCSPALNLVKPKDTNFRTRDGFSAVALCWIAVSLAGSVPFLLSGCFASYTDCVFESVSGFTTTGGTVLTDVESLPRGVMFWRGATHWIGGMGVLVVMLAILPSMSASAVNLLKAESTGPSPGKLAPKIKQTAKILYSIYLCITALNVLFLKISGLGWFDAFFHAFATVATGGFSSMNLSVGAYGSAAVEAITTVFMLLSGVNFALYFHLVKKDWKGFFKDEELGLYAIIVVLSIGLITVNIMDYYGSAGEALRHAAFQAASLVTTTGFSTVDYGMWPAMSKAVLLFLMFTGCCAGSTGGGFKLIRLLTMGKAVRTEIYRLIHPRIVRTVKINGKKIDDTMISKIFMVFFIYFSIWFAATVIVAASGQNLETSATASLAMLSNVGPGLGVAGPAGTYAGFSHVSKLALSFVMLAGRLEFMPVLVLFAPSVWRRSKGN